jgi:hypothetical protein
MLLSLRRSDPTQSDSATKEVNCALSDPSPEGHLAMLLQQERSGIEPLVVDPERIQAVLAKDGNRQT